MSIKGEDEGSKDRKVKKKYRQPVVILFIFIRNIIKYFKIKFPGLNIFHYIKLFHLTLYFIIFTIFNIMSL